MSMAGMGNPKSPAKPSACQTQGLGDAADRVRIDAWVKQARD